MIVFRRFVLWRHQDVTGISGTGVVAYGVQYPDGVCAYRWCSQWKTTAVAESVDDIVSIHGHNGATIVTWLDGEDDTRLQDVLDTGEIVKASRAAQEGERDRPAA